MKKKIVITTEKREVWIVRWPFKEREAAKPAKQEGDSADPLALVSDQYSETDILPAGHEYRSIKGEQE